MIYNNVLLRNITIGAVVGLLLWFARLSPYQAFMVGGFITIALGSFQTVQRDQKRKGVAIFGWIGTVALYFFGFVIQAFGYKIDYRLFFAFTIVFLVILALAWYIKNARLKYGLLVVIVTGTFVYAIQSFSACSFIPCQPANWGEQQAFIRQIAQTYGTHWSVEGIRAEPPNDTIYWFTEQPNLHIRVFLIRTIADSGSTNDISSFSYYDVNPRKTLQLDDEFGVKNVSTMDQQRDTLALVAISPREAFTATRQAGYEFLGRVPASYEIDIDLQLEEDIPDEFGTQPVWKVMYVDFDRNLRLNIWVNTTTGRILKKENRAY